VVSAALRRLKTVHRPRIVAIDLGTTTTRIQVVGEDRVWSEPTMLLCNRFGEPVAAGLAAWHMAVAEPWRVRHPVAGGIIVDPTSCQDFLRLVLCEAGLYGCEGVAVSVPAVMRRDRIVQLASVVAAAAAAPVVSMRPVVSAAAAAPDHAPRRARPHRLICDIGAGVLDVGAICDGQLRTLKGAIVATHAFVDDPALVTGELAKLVHAVLAKVPGEVAAELVAQPVELVGGGPQSLPLLELIMVALNMDIEVPEDGQNRVVRGLARSVQASLESA
jgi:actin-like ATPase involved in cell morphogenesis